MRRHFRLAARPLLAMTLTAGPGLPGFPHTCGLWSIALTLVRRNATRMSEKMLDSRISDPIQVSAILLRLSIWLETPRRRGLLFSQILDLPLYSIPVYIVLPQSSGGRHRRKDRVFCSPCLPLFRGKKMPTATGIAKKEELRQRASSSRRSRCHHSAKPRFGPYSIHGNRRTTPFNLSWRRTRPLSVKYWSSLVQPCRQKPIQVQPNTT